MTHRIRWYTSRMAAKKSTKKATTKQGRAKRTARRKLAPTKRPVERKLARPKKTRRKAAHKVALVNAVGKRPIGSTTIGMRKKAVGRKSQSVETVPFPRGQGIAFGWAIGRFAGTVRR